MGTTTKKKFAATFLKMVEQKSGFGQKFHTADKHAFVLGVFEF